MDFDAVLFTGAGDVVMDIDTIDPVVNDLLWRAAQYNRLAVDQKSAVVLKSGASPPVNIINSSLRCALRFRRRDDWMRLK